MVKMVSNYAWKWSWCLGKWLLAGWNYGKWSIGALKAFTYLYMLVGQPMELTCGKTRVTSWCRSLNIDVATRAKLVCYVLMRSSCNRNVDLTFWKFYNLILIWSRVSKRVFVSLIETKKWFYIQLYTFGTFI